MEYTVVIVYYQRRSINMFNLAYEVHQAVTHIITSVLSGIGGVGVVCYIIGRIL